MNTLQHNLIGRTRQSERLESMFAFQARYVIFPQVKDACSYRTQSESAHQIPNRIFCCSAVLPLPRENDPRFMTWTYCNYPACETSGLKFFANKESEASRLWEVDWRMYERFIHFVSQTSWIGVSVLINVFVLETLFSFFCSGNCNTKALLCRGGGRGEGAQPEHNEWFVEANSFKGFSFPNKSFILRSV